MFCVLWTTEDGREHHNTFGNAEGDDIRDETIEKVEAFCKMTWQLSVVEGEKDDKARVRSMSIFEGRHISWDKEETQIVSKFKLKFKSKFPGDN